MGVRHKFIYDGVSSADFNLWILGKATYGAPKRRTESEAVLGRNGELTIDYGNYENADITYKQCSITEDFDRSIEAFRDFLMTRVGYKRLEDTYHPEEYRMARVSKEFDPTVVTRRNAATFDLVFDCMPERFLKAGEVQKVFTEDGSIYNFTPHASQPKIMVSGVGTVTIGESTIAIKKNDSVVTLDSQIARCTCNDSNWSANVDLSDKEYPMLAAGRNGIVLGEGITKVVIEPRWYRL